MINHAVRNFKVKRVRVFFFFFCTDKAMYYLYLLRIPSYEYITYIVLANVQYNI